MLSRFSNLVMPPWVKLIPAILILLLVAALAWQTDQLKHSRQMLGAEREARSSFAKVIGAQDTWPSITAHGQALVITDQNFENALKNISATTLANKARADKLDAQLRQEQAENDRKFAAARRTIQDLQNRKATGVTATDNKAIEEDSKAAWRNWHVSAAPIPAGWEAPEQRFDYTHMTVPLQANLRTVNLVLHPTPSSLENGFLLYTNWRMSNLNNMQVKAYTIISRPSDGACEVHIVDPQYQWNSDARNTLGHEIAHCFYGNWHGAAF